MTKYKKLFIAVAVTIGIGIGIGATIFAPSAMNASSTNVVLASVDWVTSKLNPINSKISALETKVTNQQKEIDSLKAKLDEKLPTVPDPAPKPEPEVLPQVVYVSSSTTTVHSGATPQYKIVATYPKGAPMLVIDKYKSIYGLWYRVSLSPTLKGWVNSNAVSTNKTATTKNLEVVTVNSTQLRRGASTSYSITESLSRGTSLKYIQTFINNISKEVWYNVESSTGKKGWILATHGQVK